MRVLVTGGAGFIGAHLARALQERRDEVVLLDDFNAYYDPRLKRARLQALVRSGTTLLKCDIAESENLNRALQEVRPEAVVHCAAWAGVRASRNHSAQFAKANVLGTVNLFDACVRVGVRQVIFASSSSVYGTDARVPLSEDQTGEHPASPYGVSKRSGEQYAWVAHSLEGLQVTCLRFFSVYGPWGRPDMSYWRFTERVLKGDPLVLYSRAADGREVRRDFTAVGDIVRGVVAALGANRPFAIVNLGTSVSVSLRDFVAQIEESLGKPAVIQEKILPPGEAVETAAEVTRAADLFGYKPSTALAEGMGEFVRWYREEFRKTFPQGLTSSQFWS